MTEILEIDTKTNFIKWFIWNSPHNTYSLCHTTIYDYVYNLLESQFWLIYRCILKLPSINLCRHLKQIKNYAFFKHMPISTYVYTPAIINPIQYYPRFNVIYLLARRAQAPMHSNNKISEIYFAYAINNILCNPYAVWLNANERAS